MAAKVCLLCHAVQPAAALWMSLRDVKAGGSEVHWESVHRGEKTLGTDLSIYRLLRVDGYNHGVIGNLAGVQSLPSMSAPRNHAVVSPVMVGTPAQHMSCLLDMSTADLWLPSARCSSCANDKSEQQRFFHAQNSSTFQYEAAKTSFGPMLQALRVVHGGGSAAGFIVKDKVTFASITLPDQKFLLPEEGSNDVKRFSAWNGVCGIGWHSSQLESPPIYMRLPDAKLHSMITLLPARRGVSPQLIIGSVPDDIQSSSSFAWTPALSSRSSWVASAEISVQSSSSRMLYSQQAPVVFETGTSFLLVPGHSYLPFVRALFPDGAFDTSCGFDQRASNVVICDCELEHHIVGTVILEFPTGGGHHRVQIRPQDMFERVNEHSQASHTMCILQVQQRLHSMDMQSPFGVFGSRFQAKSGAHFPFPWPFSVPSEHASRLVKEVVVEIKGDGTTCETEVVRAMNDTVLSSASQVIQPDGSAHVDHGHACAGTSLDLASARAQSQQPQHQRQHQHQTGTKRSPWGLHFRNAAFMSDPWVLGDLFLQRHAVVLDFERQRIGFAEVSEAALHVSASASDSDVQNVSAQDYERYLIQNYASELAPAKALQACVWNLGFLGNLAIMCALLGTATVACWACQKGDHPVHTLDQDLE